MSYIFVFLFDFYLISDYYTTVHLRTKKGLFLVFSLHANRSIVSSSSYICINIYIKLYNMLSNKVHPSYSLRITYRFTAYKLLHLELKKTVFFRQFIHLNNLSRISVGILFFIARFY